MDTANQDIDNLQDKKKEILCAGHDIQAMQQSQ